MSGGGWPRRKGCSRDRDTGVGVGRTGAVEVDVSLAAVGVPDGRLVGVELALLVATILAGEGSIGGVDWGLSVAFQQHCREERRHFRQAPGFEPSPVASPNSKLRRYTSALGQTSLKRRFLEVWAKGGLTVLLRQLYVIPPTVCDRFTPPGTRGQSCGRNVYTLHVTWSHCYVRKAHGHLTILHLNLNDLRGLIAKIKLGLGSRSIIRRTQGKTWIAFTFPCTICPQTFHHLTRRPIYSCQGHATRQEKQTKLT